MKLSLIPTSAILVVLTATTTFASPAKPNTPEARDAALKESTVQTVTIPSTMPNTVTPREALINALSPEPVTVASTKPKKPSLTFTFSQKVQKAFKSPKVTAAKKKAVSTTKAIKAAIHKATYTKP